MVKYNKTIDDNLVRIVYNDYVMSLRNIGVKVKIPTNLEKTYQFRTIKEYVNRCFSNGLDADMTRAMIPFIVKYARDNKLLRKGVTILLIRNVYDICFKYVRNEMKNKDAILNDIVTSSNFVKSESISVDSKIDGVPVVIKWYNDRRIGINWLAVSDDALRAIKELPEDKKFLVPSLDVLLERRLSILLDKELSAELSKIITGWGIHGS